MFQKGKVKTGGRQPGSTNLITKDLRGRVLDIVESNLEGLEDTLEQIKGGLHYSKQKDFQMYVCT